MSYSLMPSIDAPSSCDARSAAVPVLWACDAVQAGSGRPRCHCSTGLRLALCQNDLCVPARDQSRLKSCDGCDCVCLARKHSWNVYPHTRALQGPAPPGCVRVPVRPVVTVVVNGVQLLLYRRDVG